MGTDWIQTIVIGVLVGPIASTGCATSYGIQQDRSSQRQVVGYYSQQGENPGTMNFILGALTATTAIGLLANGSVQLNRAIQLRQYCTNTELCDGEPLNFKYAAAGTSFALVVPLAIASGFLLRSAVRSYQDHHQWHRRRTSLQWLPLPIPSTLTRPSFLKYSVIATPKESNL